jgi:hypothetical protein
MKRILFAAALLALAARLTIYAESGTTSNLISFAVFWVCAVAFVVSYVLT